jgi:DNA-binding transcriptional ArsR family regulator
MDNETRTRAAGLFGALGNPTRLRIVGLLNEGGRTVNEIAGELEIGQSSASQHLAILTRAGLLAVEPRGSARHYRVRGPRIGQILTLIEEFCHIHGLRGEVSGESGDLTSQPMESTSIHG